MYYDVAGTISKQEARAALREHKGNIWAAVTECVETRQTKVLLIPHNFRALFEISLVPTPKDCRAIF
jgi:hypothetical protein